MSTPSKIPLPSSQSTYNMSEQSFTNGSRASPAPSNRSNRAPASNGTPDMSDTRKRQSKRDEAIRNKIEKDLARKRPGARRGNTTQSQQQQSQQPHSRGGGPSARPKQGTVSALRPLPALTVPSNITVADASQLCAAKRTDCVLVVDEDEHLCGIFTAKDLAFRVVGDGLDPRTTLVSEIMTPNPMVTRDSTSATEALQTMVQKHFRHLPVCNEDGDVVGLLDITKVFQESLEKLEKAYGSSQQLAKAFEGAQDHLGGVENQALMMMIQSLRDRVSFPDLGSILDARTTPAMVTVKTTVRDAAKLMRERRTTAVCVMESDGRKIAGIFTSKDVVLRVIAAGLDSKTCSVVRVMTPHPDVAEPTLSIQEALRKMHDGHYLNLPIVDEQTSLIGIVDVLKLTYAVLEQINTLSQDGTDNNSSTPAWGRLFGNLPGDDETESVVSGVDRSDMMSPVRPRPMSVETPSSEVYPHDSASGIYDDDAGSDLASGAASRIKPGQTSSVGAAVPPPDVDDGTYLFKFVAPGGTVHRFQARYDSHEFIMDIIGGKLASDPFFTTAANKAAAAPSTAASEDEGSTATAVTLPDPKDFQVLYTDDDGDLVLMTSDRDVTDAVSVARKQGKDRVVLLLRGGKGWEDAMTVTVHGKHASKRRTLLRVDEEDDDGDDNEAGTTKAQHSTTGANKKKAQGQQEELVLGFLKKDQVLPASIALLAFAIVGVFAVSRSSGQQR